MMPYDAQKSTLIVAGNSYSGGRSLTAFDRWTIFNDGPQGLCLEIYLGLNQAIYPPLPVANILDMNQRRRLKGLLVIRIDDLDQTLSQIIQGVDLKPRLGIRIVSHNVKRVPVPVPHLVETPDFTLGCITHVAIILVYFEDQLDHALIGLELHESIWPPGNTTSHGLVAQGPE